MKQEFVIGDAVRVLPLKHIEESLHNRIGRIINTHGWDGCYMVEIYTCGSEEIIEALFSDEIGKVNT